LDFYQKNVENKKEERFNDNPLKNLMDKKRASILKKGPLIKRMVLVEDFMKSQVFFYKKINKICFIFL